MLYQIRIIGGNLKGRKLKLHYHPHIRPLADRAREALFSILGDAVPDRPFYDLFAGSGAVGIEALSRGASRAVFVERDPQAARDIQAHLDQFALSGQAQVIRGDVYRWAEQWRAPSEPVNVFIGPPYRHFDQDYPALQRLVETLQQRLVPGSVITVQSEERFPAERLPGGPGWDVRQYGRTQLALWVCDGQESRHRAGRQASFLPGSMDSPEPPPPQEP
jgi:16S rRNA (guanine(966)-N(2))-methyltransferase RsmD